MPHAFRYTLIAVLVAAVSMVGGLAAARATGHSGPEEFWVAGSVGLTLGMMTAWRRYGQDRSKRSAGR